MPLKILFAPLHAEGHVYSAIGIAQQLANRGHEVVFLITNSFRGRLAPLGFTEVHLQQPDEGFSKAETIEQIKAMSPVLAMGPLQLLEYAYVPYLKWMAEEIKGNDAKLRKIMDEVKPDAVVVDIFMQTPALIDQGIPWVLVASINSVAISNVNVPPPFTGFPVVNGDKTTWNAYRAKEQELLKSMFETFKIWVKEHGGPELKFSDSPLWIKYSPWANLYLQPEELSYSEFRPDPPNWHRLDAFVRTDPEPFEVPEKLQTLPGKLIYVSMGTWGCLDILLMRRLLGIFAKSPNRFIVATGPLGDEMDFGDNTWGAERVPQTNVIPLVDLVITHGGNNTITESFYFGKPVLVLPLCFDQLDTAQRIEDTGLGLRLQPYHATEEEILAGIEKLCGDEVLEKKMRSIGNRIQASNSQAKAADLIENAAETRKKSEAN